jgi:hypothetical protein
LAESIDANSSRARMAPKDGGGWVIASWLSAEASDPAGESVRDARSEFISDRRERGKKLSIDASARWPSTAR